ncbi:MAG: GNAT family N-acetyltransferase, partial [Anaerolineae bacterium]|nr:GNAT family N-acetyltransferase [Anaerolineae bacterium]
GYEAIVRQGAVRFMKREDLWLMLVRKMDGELVGGSGLHRIDWSVPCFEIGYWVRQQLEGQGYITEAVHGITDFAFGTLNAARVEIRCDTRNTRSAAVAERCGYTLEGTLRHDARDTDGELRDTHIFGLIRPEWEAARA